LGGELVRSRILLQEPFTVEDAGYAIKRAALRVLRLDLAKVVRRLLWASVVLVPLVAILAYYDAHPNYPFPLSPTATAKVLLGIIFAGFSFWQARARVRHNAEGRGENESKAVHGRGRRRLLIVVCVALLVSLGLIIGMVVIDVQQRAREAERRPPPLPSIPQSSEKQQVNFKALIDTLAPTSHH
jgi:hypothetical protein